MLLNHLDAAAGIVGKVLWCKWRAEGLDSGFVNETPPRIALQAVYFCQLLPWSSSTHVPLSQNLRRLERNSGTGRKAVIREDFKPPTPMPRTPLPFPRAAPCAH